VDILHQQRIGTFDVTPSAPTKTKRSGRPLLAAAEPLSAIAETYWCGALLSIWLLQYFFISSFDSLGLLAFCASMQSFICCLWDL